MHHPSNPGPESGSGSGFRWKSPIPIFVPKILQIPSFREPAKAILLLGALVMAILRSSAAGAGTFEVRGYQTDDGGRLDPAVVDRIMAEATGPTVGLPQIRRAMARLQQAYRDVGLTNAGVLMPRQTISESGRVRLRIVGIQSDPSDGLPSWQVPTYEIRHFVIQGNEALDPGQIDQILGPVAGDSVSPVSLESALRGLREAYRALGWTNASIKVPSQRLIDGTVLIRVEQGTPPPAAKPAGAAVAGGPPPKERGLEIRRISVEGNTLLAPEVVDRILAPAIGTNVTIPGLQKALGDLQLAYRERGWATVSVGLPQQQITNAVVRVRVVEGTLADIRITGNRHFSSNNVIAALPSLRTNSLLNSRIFQRELDIANQNRDRQVYPVLGPGPDPGTSALTLRVKDRLPLHGRIEVNNVTMAKAPEWRVNSSLSHNNLWQREHQIGLNYSFSPERFSEPSPSPDLLFNRPLIASYGAYYRMPFGDPQAVEDAVRKSGSYGFDEATRQFRLPPAGSRSDLYFFGNAAKLDTGVQYGPLRLVSQSAGASITAQDTGRNLVAIESAGARLNLPFALSDTRRLSVSWGLEARRLGLESFNTNNFRFTATYTNSQGTQTLQSDSASPQPPRRNEFLGIPLTAGIDFSQTDASGSSAAGLAITYNLAGSGADYDAIAYSPVGGAHFGKAALNLTREQRLPGGLTALLRSGGQVATGPLLFSEQFAVGGMNTVRGYFEGDSVSDAGWNVSGEVRTPQWSLQVPAGDAAVPAWLRGLVFMDFGQVYPSSRESAVNRRDLWSTGLGVSASLNNTLDLKVTVGWPLIDSANSQRGEPRANLSVGGQF